MAIDDERRPDQLGGTRRRRVTEEQSNGRVPSVVLAVAVNGQTVDTVSVGLADVDHEVAACPTVPYRIGSITKTFTAALVLLLAEEGVLGLDDRVEDHLPGTPFGAVSLRALLSHCSGLQREAPVDMWESMNGPDAEQLLRALGSAELVSRPGARWHYSNLGYAVLGQIVERATGVACDKLVDKRLIEPLGLTGTSWAQPTNAAAGYRVDPYADRVHPEPVMNQAAVGVGGQLWSTATDLLAWGDALAGGAPSVLGPSVVDTMHTLHVMVDRTSWTSGWGLGLILERRGDRVTAGHTGAMPGFLSALSFDRATRSVVVALSNATRGAAVGALAGEVLDDLVSSTPERQPTVWSIAGEVPAELDGILGRWWSEADETVFTWRATGLHAQLLSVGASEVTRFERLSDDVYRAVEGRFTGERLTVRRDAAGNVTELEWATYPFTREPR